MPPMNIQVYAYHYATGQAIWETPFDQLTTIGQLKEEMSRSFHNKRSTQTIEFVRFMAGRMSDIVEHDKPYWSDDTTIAQYMAYYAGHPAYCWLYYVVV